MKYLLMHKVQMHIGAISWVECGLCMCLPVDYLPVQMHKPYIAFCGVWLKIEPPHDKTNKMTVRPVKTQISLGIHPVWSVFTVCSMGSKGPRDSSCGQQKLWSDSANSQADLSLCWAQSHSVGFVMRRLSYLFIIIKCPLFIRWHCIFPCRFYVLCWSWTWWTITIWKCRW